MRTSVLILLLIGALANCGYAQERTTPPLVNYQGRLTDANGTAMPNGSYKLTVRLYPQSTGGSPVWEENLQAPVAGGQFNVILGSTSALSAANLAKSFNSKDTFLELVVLSDAAGNNLATPHVLAPRQQILSTPFALQAESALNGVPLGTVVPYFGKSAPNGWLMCDGTAYPREGAYANLFQVIGVSCGAPDATSFNVPDLRGRFLRGADDPDGAGTRYERANRDPDAASRGEMKPGGETGVGPGTIQASEFGRHSHGDVRFAAPGHQHWMPLGGDGAGVFYSNVTPGTRVVTNRTGLAWGLLGKSAASGGPVRESPTYPNEDTAAVPADGGKETRPVNATVNYIIKY